MRFIPTLLLVALLSFSACSSDKPKEKHIVLSEDNVLVLNTQVDGTSVSKLMEEASKLDSNLPSNYPIYLVLYTPGGSIVDGIDLFHFMAGLNRPIHTVTIFAASMGFQIAQQMNDRYILPFGILMSHKAKGGFEGEFGDGESQIDSRYGMWMKLIKMMDEQTVMRTEGKQTLQSYRDAYRNELWVTGSEAVEKGYADAVATVICDGTLKGKEKVVEAVGLFGIKFKVTMSKCPLNQNPIRVESTVDTSRGPMTLDEFLTSGGKFGPCDETELCPLNTILKLEDYEKATDEKIQFLNRDLKKHVINSF